MSAARIQSMMEAIPGYRLLELLGQGGCGEVWKAEAPGGVLKAVKLVYGSLQSAIGGEDLVQQELKSLDLIKRIRHPYILGLDRYDIIGGQLLVITELADRNLWDRFKQCEGEGQPGIPRTELLRYLIEAAEGLDLMNFQHGLQHCDIKPQNFLLVYGHIKIADFGLVRPVKGGKASVTGVVTPLYAAPEMFEGWASTSSDQYSLAIVYQELLTGRHPFPGTNSRQLYLQHLTQPPDLTQLPAADQPVIGKALSKKPSDRYRSCTDFLRALRGQTVVPASAAARGGTVQPVAAPTARIPTLPTPPNGLVRPLVEAKANPTPAAVAPAPAPKPAAASAPPASVKAQAATPPAPPAPAPAAAPPAPAAAAPPPAPAPAAAAPGPAAAPPPPPAPPAKREPPGSQVMVALECPHCRYQGTAPGSFIGLRVRCPTCRREFAVADAIDSIFVPRPVPAGSAAPARPPG
jgi:hypothetical protein